MGGTEQWNRFNILRVRKKNAAAARDLFSVSVNGLNKSVQCALTLRQNKKKSAHRADLSDTGCCKFNLAKFSQMIPINIKLQDHKRDLSECQFHHSQKCKSGSK